MKYIVTIFVFIFANAAFAQELINRESLGHTIQEIITKNELNINWNYVDATYSNKTNTIEKGYCYIHGFYSQLVDSSLIYFNINDYYDKKQKRYKNIFWKKVIGITRLNKDGTIQTIGLAPKKIKIPSF